MKPPRFSLIFYQHNQLCAKTATILSDITDFVPPFFRAYAPLIFPEALVIESARPVSQIQPVKEIDDALYSYAADSADASCQRIRAKNDEAPSLASEAVKSASPTPDQTGGDLSHPNVLPPTQYTLS